MILCCLSLCIFVVLHTLLLAFNTQAMKKGGAFYINLIFPVSGNGLLLRWWSVNAPIEVWRPSTWRYGEVLHSRDGVSHSERPRTSIRTPVSKYINNNLNRIINATVCLFVRIYGYLMFFQTTEFRWNLRVNLHCRHSIITCSTPNHTMDFYTE